MDKVFYKSRAFSIGASDLTPEQKAKNFVTVMSQAASAPNKNPFPSFMEQQQRPRKKVVNTATGVAKNSTKLLSEGLISSEYHRVAGIE